MQPIHQAISHLPWKKKLLSLDEIQKDILNHPLVMELRREHPEITIEILERSLAKLDQAIKENNQCGKCLSLAECPNLMKGHEAKLVWTGAYLELVYTPCPKWIAEQAQKKREKLIQSHYIPREVLTASFQNFEQDPTRFTAFRTLMEFCLQVEPGSKERKMKGIYLYGPLGVGKSYLMAATARKLADRGISSLMVYAPDFFREMKESIQDNSVQEKVGALKTVPVLILDDIGADNMTPWIRDEVLGAILQFRITNNLPTLFTSNYNYELLEEHLSHSAKGGIEVMKAKRIMERIIYYTDAYFVDGPNRRREN
jgi:primosomal protein DnaI